MKYFLTTAALALVLSSSAAMSEPKRPMTVAELDEGMTKHGCKQHLYSDEDQATLLITCAQNVVVHDKNLRTWFFLTILQTPGSTAIKNMQPRYS